MQNSIKLVAENALRTRAFVVVIAIVLSQKSRNQMISNSTRWVSSTYQLSVTQEIIFLKRVTCCYKYLLGLRFWPIIYHTWKKRWRVQVESWEIFSRKKESLTEVDKIQEYQIKNFSSSYLKTCKQSFCLCVSYKMIRFIAFLSAKLKYI